MHTAIDGGDLATFKLLLIETDNVRKLLKPGNKNTVDQPGMLGNSPIQLALLKRKNLILDYLIRSEPNMKHQNKDGDTVYHIAARKEF